MYFYKIKLYNPFVAYNFKIIERKWQGYWKKNQTFKAINDNKLKKYYILDMFPYPSGAGLHVGHPLGYIATDIIARYKRHKGFNVLHPQGYDSFGLPAEQYAIETGKHPADTTEKNIKQYRRQLDRMGFSFDWSREIRTSSSNYYKWTQWIFLLLFDSYYDLNKDKAKSISDLVYHFENNGTLQLNAVTDNIEQFNSDDWKSFSFSKKQEILLRYRLAYLSETEVNWCPNLGTVLANDEIINGVSERGGFLVEKKKMKQWSMRIGAYSERLINDLEKIDWPESLKEMQRNWIGRSVGAFVKFKIKGHEEEIKVFTTRPDTLYGVTFMTLAPEHNLTLKITTNEYRSVVKKYINSSRKKSELDRMSDVKTISGVFSGSYAIHPFNGNEIPIWIGDYVLSGYGTGAVMAVPCGDQRDYDFAKKFKIPIKNIFSNKDISKCAFVQKSDFKLINSGFLNDLEYEPAINKVINYLESKNFGKGAINYRLRDAIFSRQRYWGEPIPVYYKNDLPIPLSLKDLPLKLPKVKNYLPTSDGAPPLGNATKWAWDISKGKVVDNSLINNIDVFPLELNTMPGWAGSSWYFNRYMDACNENEFVSKKAVNYWKEVDLYLGGSEHATGHLMYSRFWQKFLYDLGYLPVDEYAKKLINQGMILGYSAFIHRKKGTQEYYSSNLLGNYKTEPIRVDISFVNSSNELDIEGLKESQIQYRKSKFKLEKGKFFVTREVEKMSKSKFNVVNPDEICEKYGADTLRMHEMFLGPLEQSKPWNTAGISGVHSFLKKLWRLYHPNKNFSVNNEKPTKKSLKYLNQTIKKVTEDIESQSFNTCISSFMICVNQLTSEKCNERQILEPLIILLSPFAPHISEELWSLLGHNSSIAKVKYPKYDSNQLVELSKNYPVSFNGKMTFTIELSLDLPIKEIEKIILNDKRTKEQLKGKQIKKVIVVLGKIINIVV